MYNPVVDRTHVYAIDKIHLTPQSQQNWWHSRCRHQIRDQEKLKDVDILECKDNDRCIKTKYPKSNIVEMQLVAKDVVGGRDNESALETIVG